MHQPQTQDRPALASVLDRRFDAIEVEHLLADFAGWQAMPRGEREAMRDRADAWMRS